MTDKQINDAVQFTQEERSCFKATLESMASVAQSLSMNQYYPDERNYSMHLLKDIAHAKYDHCVEISTPKVQSILKEKGSPKK